MRFFHFIDKLLIGVGRYTYASYSNTINLLKFCIATARQIPHVFKNIQFTLEQMHVIGTQSILLVSVTSIFTGSVGALTFLTQVGDFVPLRYVGASVGTVVIVAVGPVLTGLVITGRVGAAIASELGTMVVTEQVDAMKCLNLNPFRFLIAPRLVAGMIMVPVLNIFSTFIAILGAFSILFILTGISSNVFFSGVRLFYTDWGLAVGILKSFAFGIIITIMGCYFGYNSAHGAVGVGKATRASVVFSDIAILITGYLMDYFLLNSSFF